MVGGKRVAVKVRGDMEESRNYDHDAGTITVHKDLEPDNARDCLRHELVHAALAIGGVSFALDSDIEEAVVRTIEQIFFPAWNRLQGR